MNHYSEDDIANDEDHDVNKLAGTVETSIHKFKDGLTAQELGKFTQDLTGKQEP